MTTTDREREALETELTGLLSELIALRSDYPPGDTHAICAYTAERLRRAGYAVEVATHVEPFANVVASMGTGTPRIVFNAHADTVGVDEPQAWLSDPFHAEMRDGRVYGLGAANCKASMAAQIWVAEQIAQQGGPGETGEIVFTFVGDEETIGPNGMGYLRASGRVEPDVLIFGATTDNQLIVAERGVMWVRITSLGRAAHAGDPSAGDNAIERMLRLLACLQRELVPAVGSRRDGDMVSTVNIGLIHGGHNTNAVPSKCTVEIDRRLLPGEDVDTAFEEICTVLEHAGEPPGTFSVERLLGSPGFKGRHDGAGVKAFRAAIAARTGTAASFYNAIGVSDGRHFAQDGIEIIGFGPGAGTEGHAANESIAVAQLADAAVIYKDVVDRLLGLNE